MSNTTNRVMAKLADTLSVSEIPSSITGWLTKLNILQGVPFTNLVADERLLEPECIKFFQLDQTWMDALVDGALSIGRQYTGTDTAAPSLIAEQIHRPRVHQVVRGSVRNVRRSQLKKEPVLDDSPVRGVVTGFLLRSQALAGWKNLDVIGYPKGTSPYDNEQGKIQPDQIKALDTLRLEALSSTVLFGLFQGQLYELVIHQPPEAIHFGFETVTVTSNIVTKTLRVPTTNWDDPNTSYDTQTYQNQSISGIFTDTTNRVINMYQLSQTLGQKLSAIGKAPDCKAPDYYAASPDADQKDHLVSSDFALEMVEGVGLVSFINDVLPS